MSLVLKQGACPFCNALIRIEIEEPYTVRSGQACDWEPGYTEVLPTCACGDTLESLGGDWERYEDFVLRSAVS